MGAAVLERGAAERLGPRPEDFREGTWPSDHAGAPWITVRAGGLRRTFPPGREVVVGRESGRGLALVEALAHTWGQVPLSGGKVVWFDVLRSIR